MKFHKMVSILSAWFVIGCAAKALTAHSGATQSAPSQAASPPVASPKEKEPAIQPEGGQVPLCSGESTPDVPIEVTKQMSMVGPSVVAVYQLTGLDGHGKGITTRGGAVITNYLTNSDMTIYTGKTNPPVFIVNSQGALGPQVMTIRVDHRGAQLASTKGGNHLRVSVDGLSVSQAWRNGRGVDILFTSLAGPGRCTTKFITNLNLVPAQGGAVSGIATTNPSWDPAKHLYHVCYAPGGGNSDDPGKIYCAYSDGSHSEYPAIEPKDACKGFVYHKSRMNYRFPYLVAMQRENGVGPNSIECNDLIDLRTGAVVADLGDGHNGHPFYNHDDWSPDGQELLEGGSLSTGGVAYVRVLDAAGHVRPGFDQPKSNSNPNGYVLLNRVSQAQAEWCSFGPNHDALCTSRVGVGGRGFPVQVPENCHPAFSIDLNTLAIKFITCTDGWATRQYEGQAVIRYAYTDASGNAHALFRSDKSANPQVYEVVYKP